MPSTAPSAHLASGRSFVDAAIDSAPNPHRDIDAEIRALLARADEARAQADAIDLVGATEQTLARAAEAAGKAMETGASAAERCTNKVHEQQERFKANVLSAGGSLEEDVSWIHSGKSAGNAAPLDENLVKPEAGNKYSMMMDRRRNTQDIERMQ